jgi:hypothetical protein
MSLRFSTALLTGAALAVSSLAHAKSAPVAPITIESLARVEGVFSYCATIDPKSATQYHQILNTIISGHSTPEISDDQKTSRYKYAMGVADSNLAKLPVSTVLSACRNALVSK